MVNPSRFIGAFFKTLGFTLFSLFPIGIYVFNYTSNHDNQMPTSYQEYAVRVMTICFPILATKLCFDNDKSWFKSIVFSLLICCLFYIFVFEQRVEAIPSIFDQLFFYLTIAIYIGTFFVSFVNFYQSPISDSNMQKIVFFRDKIANDIEKNVKW